MALLVTLWFAALAAATVAVGRSLAPRAVRTLAKASYHFLTEPPPGFSERPLCSSSTTVSSDRSGS